VRFNIDQLFCILQILEKIREYNDTVHQLFIHLKEPYGTVRRKVECGVPMKVVRLINIRLNETYSKVRVVEYLWKMI
jgi:hypothetical protein